LSAFRGRDADSHRRRKGRAGGETGVPSCIMAPKGLAGGPCRLTQPPPPVLRPAGSIL